MMTQLVAMQGARLQGVTRGLGGTRGWGRGVPPVTGAVPVLLWKGAVEIVILKAQGGHVGENGQLRRHGASQLQNRLTA